MKAYLAGKMSGIPAFNFPAFDAAAEALRAAGHTIYSPAELDDPETRAASLASPDGKLGSVGNWEEFLARDLRIICDPEVEAVIVLDGWETSKGACLETDVAKRLGKPILRYPSLEPIAEETRIVDPRTGGAKGRKRERYDLIPMKAMDDVARVYGMGALKYDDWNWALGYDWSLSIGAAFRHMAAFAAGEDLDTESGLPHPAHAAFHMLALITFMTTHRAGDDRWLPPELGASPRDDAVNEPPLSEVPPR